MSAEEQLYVSLDGILGRNVKRVQDGLKRVKEAMETEDRSNTKDNFSTWTRRGSGLGVYFVVFVCLCVLRCVCADVSSPIPTSYTTRGYSASLLPSTKQQASPGAEVETGDNSWLKSLCKCLV